MKRCAHCGVSDMTLEIVAEMCPSCRIIERDNEIGRLKERISDLEGTNEGLKIALRSLSETRSDATRLLPLGGEPWQTIAAALQEWKDEEISTNKLREIIVMELRDLDVDR